MPDGDGIDFLKRLRDDSSGRGDPSSARSSSW